MPLPLCQLRSVALEFSPAEAAARLRHLPGLVFFDSARETAGDGALSLVAANPAEVVRGNLFTDACRLEDLLQAWEAPTAADDGLPRGIVAGWVEYDGSFCFGAYPEALIFRHRDQQWLESGPLSSRFMEPAPGPVSRGPQFVRESTPEQFGAMVRRAQEYIAAGDIYQVNLAHQLRARWPGDCWGFYEALRHYSPAPFAAYLELDGRTVLSASPESFLHLSGRAIRTRPIKGTRPRRPEPLADERSAYELLTSPKEIAELVMITDLERSDLGQVCEYGSVHVAELLRLERYEQIFHLVSTVEGRLRPEVSHLDALRACFPGGSITGAPKRRAREIISELEPSPRGLYTGAVGWFAGNGESQFNIAIRTVVVEGGEARFHVGAGIVADSIPEREWDETMDKAAGILLAAERMGENVLGD